MKLSCFIFLSLLSICCNNSYTSSEIRNANPGSQYFKYFSSQDTLAVDVLYFYKSVPVALGRGMPYDIVIGKVHAPLAAFDTITILTIGLDSRVYIGKNIKIVEGENPFKNTSIEMMPLSAFDTTVNGKFHQLWVIGSQYPAIWGKILEREAVQLPL